MQNLCKEKEKARGRWFLLLLGCLFSINAMMAQPDVNPKNITYQCKNEQLSKALRQVERLSGYYKIQFAYEDVGKYTVSVTLKDVTVQTALSELLQNTDLNYEIDNRFIHVFRVAAERKLKQSLSGSVNGQVVDEHGEPLIGVTVRVLGTNEGTITDLNGNFSLSSGDKKSVKLLLSYIGKKDKEVTASSGKSLKVIMVDDSQLLSDVVVTGYQTLSRERSAGSYGIIKGDAVSSKIGLTGSIIQSLEGLATGLSVNMSEGADKYIVRGITSVYSNRSPLFVVDGMPLEEDQVETLLNGNDIENVTLLKDATAASIWGSQAANGVVVITTKKGQKSNKTHISYDGSFTYIGKPDYGYMKMMDGATFMKNAQEIFDIYSEVYDYDYVSTTATSYGSDPFVLPHERYMYAYKMGKISMEERDAALARLAAQDGRKSYEDNFMSDKWMTRHTISLSGGTDKQNFYVSLGYIGEQGTLKDMNNRFTFNIKQNFNLTPWLKWDYTVNGVYGSLNKKVEPWTYTAIYRDLPYATFYDENGEAVDWAVYYVADDKREKAEELTNIDTSFFPVDDLNSSSSKQISTNLRVNTGLTFSLLKGLRYETRYQYSRFHTKTETFLPQETYAVCEERLQATDANTLECVLPAKGGHFTLDNGLVTDWTFRNQLTYDGDFQDGKHQITALLGTELREYVNTTYNSFVRGYDMQTMLGTDYDIYALRNYISNPVYGESNGFSYRYFSQNEIMRRYFSLYGNAAYTFDHKYVLNASLRMDQSNLFGSDPDTQYKPIWSVGLAWKISEERFMDRYDWLNSLTLRATYGFAGNSPDPGMGGKYDILSATSSPWFEESGYDISTPANNKLTWEKTRTYNLGFDLSVLNHRLNVTLDYYDKKTTDLIAPMSLNPTSGWAMAVGNIGSVSNKGLEISVNSHNIKSDDFNWYTILTFSQNKSKVLKLEVESTDAINLMQKRVGYREGYPTGPLFSYCYAGLDEEGLPQAYNKEGELISGDDLYTLDEDDEVYSGTTIPVYYGALTNRFVYKDWELSFMFIYNFGNKMRKQCVAIGNDSSFSGRRLTGNLYRDFDKRWRQPGDEAYTDIPRYSAYSEDSDFMPYYYADRNVLDASYIKLRDLTLTYRLSSELCRKFYAESARINLQIGNLFYWAANNEGIDPEAYAYSGFSNNYQEKFGPTYSVGVNINF